MAVTSRLGRQLSEILAALDRLGIQAALVGGLALSPHKVVRATQDIDLLIDQTAASRVHDEVMSLGYQCLHRSDEVANYQRGDERLDFLFASRPVARRLLVEAREVDSSLGRLRVISAEGLIGFKLQGVVNDPRRTQDLEDIKALLRANGASPHSMNSSGKSADPPAVDAPLIAEGGVPFSPAIEGDPFKALDDLMCVVEALIPTWPAREPMREGKYWLL